MSSTSLNVTQPEFHQNPSASEDANELQALELAIEILPKKLYFVSLGSHPTSTDKRKYFTVDYDLIYEPYFADFGPLHLGHFVAFCRALQYQMAQLDADADIVFYTSHNGHQRANAGCLIACYCVAVLGMTPNETWSKFSTAYPPFLSFRDASYGISTFGLTIFDILSGLYKAIQLNWFSVEKFDLEKYNSQAELDNGDWHWIVPGRFVGFSSPQDHVPGREAARLVKPFREGNIQLVVRLNERLYDKRVFTEVGIRHVDLQFPDGTIPSDAITGQFIDVAEKQSGAIAVHCKQGVGRTGTLIGVYVIKHYGFSAKEFIGWARLCRPGCVVGPQQQYLVTMEKRFSSYLRLHGGNLPFMTPTQAWKQKSEAEEKLFKLKVTSNTNSKKSGGKNATPGSNAQNGTLNTSSQSDLNRTGAAPAAVQRAQTATPWAVSGLSTPELPVQEGDLKFDSSKKLFADAIGMRKQKAAQEARSASRLTKAAPSNSWTGTQSLNTATKNLTVTVGGPRGLGSALPPATNFQSSLRNDVTRERPRTVGRPSEVLVDLLPRPTSHASSLYTGTGSGSLSMLPTYPQGSIPNQSMGDVGASAGASGSWGFSTSSFIRPAALLQSALVVGAASSPVKSGK